MVLPHPRSQDPSVMELEFVADMARKGLTPFVPDRFPVFNLAEDIMAALVGADQANVMANNQQGLAGRWVCSPRASPALPPRP